MKTGIVAIFYRPVRIEECPSPAPGALLVTSIEICSVIEKNFMYYLVKLRYIAYIVCISTGTQSRWSKPTEEAEKNFVWPASVDTRKYPNVIPENSSDHHDNNTDSPKLYFCDFDCWNYEQHKEKHVTVRTTSTIQVNYQALTFSLWVEINTGTVTVTVPPPSMWTR